MRLHRHGVHLLQSLNICIYMYNNIYQYTLIYVEQHIAIYISDQYTLIYLHSYTNTVKTGSFHWSWNRLFFFFVENEFSPPRPFSKKYLSFVSTGSIHHHGGPAQRNIDLHQILWMSFQKYIVEICVENGAEVDSADQDFDPTVCYTLSPRPHSGLFVTYLINLKWSFPEKQPQYNDKFE